MEENEESEFSPNQRKFLNLISYFMVFFYWANLFAFLDLFFKIVLPNFGKNVFGHYLEFAVIMAIIGGVGETLRRRKNVRLFLAFTILLFAMNVLTIWWNWYAH